MNNPRSADKGIKSAETVFDILETIADRESTTVTGIADQLDYSKSTIYYYLQTLDKKRYIIKEDGNYRLGLRTASLGSKAKRHYDPENFVQERTEDLAREVDAGADVFVEEASKGVVLHRSRIRSERLVETHVGVEIDLHNTAFGKAILASLSPERREDILSSHGPEETADRPGTRKDELLEELEEIQQIGLAYAEGDFMEGVCSIAAPIIRASTGEVYGAIGIWGRPDEMTNPTRFAKARRFAGNVPEEVEKIARIIGNKL